MRIEIINWEKHQRKAGEYKNPTWFALRNRWYEDDEILLLSPAQKLIWIVLLTIASQKNSGIYQIPYEKMKLFFGFDKNIIDSTIRQIPGSIRFDKNIINSTARQNPLPESRSVMPESRSVMPESRSVMPESRRYNTIHNNTIHRIHGGGKTSDSGSNFVRPSSEKVVLSDISWYRENIPITLERKFIEIYSAPRDAEHQGLRKEIQKMDVWFSANPKKAKKTKLGFQRFVSNWLARWWDGQKKAESAIALTPSGLPVKEWKQHE